MPTVRKLHKEREVQSGDFLTDSVADAIVKPDPGTRIRASIRREGSTLGLTEPRMVISILHTPGRNRRERAEIASRAEDRFSVLSEHPERMAVRREGDRGAQVFQ